MCGIAGYFGTAELDEGRIQTCLGLMGRRGPDYAAFKHWRSPQGNNTYLLFSRLSIIDLDERANQPFQVGSKWIAYNGELYNYLEVRAQLLARGHRFSTESDTEVLLRAIDDDGWRTLEIGRASCRE